MAKDFFKEKGVEYVDMNVAEDQDKRKEMIEKSGQMGVPVITVGDELIVGYDEDRLTELGLYVTARVRLGEKYTLVYGRKGDGWKLFVEDVDGRKTDLFQAGIFVCLEASEKLEELRSLMISEAELRLEMVVAATARFRLFAIETASIAARRP